jgi:hypothetical protein
VRKIQKAYAKRYRRVIWPAKRRRAHALRVMMAAQVSAASFARMNAIAGSDAGLLEKRMAIARTALDGFASAVEAMKQTVMGVNP